MNTNSYSHMDMAGNARRSRTGIHKWEALPAGDWSRPAHQSRSRHMRDHLLAAAQDVFAAKGYEGARIADIAAAAGCSVGAIYQRFKDKESLFNAIVTAFIAEARDGVARVVERSDLPAAELMRRFIHETAAHLSGYRGLVRAILERGFGDPHLLAPMTAMRADIQKSLASIVYGSGERPADETFVMAVVAQMIYGFILNSVVNPMALSNVDGRQALDRLADAVIGHLRLM